jgi:curved DNA-binding protein CbpA
VDSPFDVLAIDSDASEAEIDRAYRRRVLETHPDQGGSAQEFQRVRAAYEQVKSGELIDPDAEWNDPGAARNGSTGAAKNGERDAAEPEQDG